MNNLIKIIIVVATLCSAPVHALEEDMKDLFGSEELISLSTGQATPQKQAPAVSTVITRKDMQSLGLYSLEEALQLVPGLHVSRHIDGNPLYLIRGIYSTYNPHVLFQINGTAITSSYHGNRGQVWAGMSTHNISKIEVIRGPGSALHGADAYAGIVNIITDHDPGSNSYNIGLASGSQGTQRTWINHKHSQGNLVINSSMHFSQSNGHDAIIQEDAQSFLDGIFATSASLAPDKANDAQKWFDVNSSMNYKKWRLNFWHQSRRDVGTYAGIAQALDTTGEKNGDRTNLDLIWQSDNDWQWRVRNSVSHFSNRSDLTIFPAGSNLGGGVFTEGMIGNPYIYELHYKGQISANYNKIAQHKLALGVGIEHNNIYKTEETKNFNPDFSPIGSTIDVSDTDLIFLKEREQNIGYLYLQDQWLLSKDISLTSGVRADYYSDFAWTFNPRLALVWNVFYDTTVKFLYGKAFRAPSFSEQFLINNPVAVGNPDLEPETINTAEIFIQYQPYSSLIINSNGYYFEMRDVIEFVGTPKTAQNNASKRGRGWELNMRYRYKSFHLLSHYAYQEVEDFESNNPLGHAPGQKWFTALTFQRGNWQVSPRFNWILDRQRAAGDNRASATPDYLSSSLLVRYQINKQSTISFKANNIFNEDIREPSPQPGRIVADLPMGGRSLLLQMEITK